MKLLLIILMLVASQITMAKEVVMSYHHYKLTRVVDGDTIGFRALFLPTPLKKELLVRIYGVDTPEIGWRAKCPWEKAHGESASLFTKNKIASAKHIRVGIYRWDKYGGRVLGDIIIDGKSLRTMLIQSGYAREYYGRKKASWCK